MDNILISIIVPAYNIENYIECCLDSLLQQEHKRLEIIVVDDGSRDSTGQIIDRYAAMDQRVVPVHKENGGVFSARLSGVEKASGTYIGFVDGDDYVEPLMFRKLLENAIKYNADISHCGYKMVFPSGRIDYYYNTEQMIRQDKIQGLKDLISGEYIEPALVNKLFHKKLFVHLKEALSKYKNIKINEDLLMNYFLFKQANLSIYEDVCLYHYILRKGSAATSKLNEHKLKDPMHVMKIILQDSKNVSEIYRIAEERLIRQMIGIAVLSASEQAALIKPFRGTVRNELRKKCFSILCNDHISTSVKVKVVWVIICPFSYRWVHNIYMKITGLDKKYSID